MLKVGTCGWSSFPAKEIYGENWKSEFKTKLQAYAERFDVVEVNSTFYRLPRLSTASRWLEEARDVNKKFEFTVKANQEITHKDRFKTSKSIEAWKETVKVAEKLGASVILLQTPASFKPSIDNIRNIKNFLDACREYWPRDIAWEPRGEWLRNLELVEGIVNEFSIIHCVDPFRSLSVSHRVYWRLHGLGHPSMYNYRFSDEELKELARKSRNRHGYIFFNNIWMGTDALRFKSLL